MAGIFSPGKRKQEIVGILIIAWGIFSVIALFEGAAGLAGELAADFYKFFLGDTALTLPALLIILGYKLVKGIEIKKGQLRIFGFLLAYISSLTIYHISQDFSSSFNQGLLGNGGGLIGGLLSLIFETFFGYIGSQIILISLTIIGLLLFFDIFLLDFISQILNGSTSFVGKLKNLTPNFVFFDNFPSLTKFLNNIWSFIKNLSKSKKEKNIQNPENKDEQPAITDSHKNDNKQENFKNKDEQTEMNWLEAAEEDPKEKNVEENPEKLDKLLNQADKSEDYTKPPLKLLKNETNPQDKAKNKSELLEKTLDNFGINANVVNVRKGPTLTRYEVQPETGVKVSKIVNLSDDIALSLAAEDVRIEAPIPGKSALGIEVPHQGASLVRLKGILQSEKFNSEVSEKLQIALGRAIDGNPVVADLTEMPHLLIAGATGSGKSVCINSIITSLLFQHSPQDLKMLLIDPKKVELVNYKKLPHLFSPLVTDCKKAAGTLKLIVEEMEKRYDLFAETGTKGIDSYNQQAEEKLPYIVVIIDELSDLMMVAANEVEDAICRLAQMSRAAGIHLVIATQRPSVDVITGLIKANIPSRIAFAVSSNTDSRTILDESGAEKLLGDGDMLFYPVGAKKPHRVQGSFITNTEVDRVVSFVKNQTDPEFFVDEEKFDDLKLEDLDEEEDELLEDAIKLVVEYRASISMLQRRLHIGHSRAARLIDKMEEMGIVGPYNGPQPREVLITEEDLGKFLQDYEETEE